MRHFKFIVLVSLIGLLSIVATLVGILSSGTGSLQEFTSIHGDVVTLYNKGIYQFDSVSIATQAIAQDYVTLIIGIPLLFISLFLFLRQSVKGKILLTGTVGYFLYTYASYSFLSMYNALFLIYVALFSLSLFTFILLMMQFDVKTIKSLYKTSFPVSFIGGVCLFIGFMLCMMWMGRIIPPLMNHELPIGLEYYSTLVIQVLDLAVIVPLAVLSGVLLLKRDSYGYLLAPILIVKGLTMLCAIVAMEIGLLIANVEVSLVEVIMFPLFALFMIVSFGLVLKNIKEI